MRKKYYEDAKENAAFEGYLRHAQRPHVHPEPHRAAAAEPRGHQGDEGAFRGTEKIIETAARPLFE